MNEDYCLYSETDENELSLCKIIFDKLTLFINEKRETALKTLNCKNNSADKKKKALNDYFVIRMNPEICKVCIEGTDYSIVDLENLGKHLLFDEKLDLNKVFDSVNYYKDSFSRDDVVLARHNLRLSQDEVSLSHLVTVIGIVINQSLQTQGLEEIMINLPSTIMSYSESKKILNDISDFIDVYLQKCCDGIDGYIHKYHFEFDDKNIPFSERVDDFATQYFSKLSPLAIHSEYIIDFLKPKVDFSKPIYVDAIYNYIIELYNEKNLSRDDNSIKNQIIFPTFHELIIYVENNHKNDYEIIENLKRIEREHNPAVLNKLFELSQEDIQISRELKQKTELETSFNNLRRSMWSLYSIVRSFDDILEYIPELGIDTDKFSNKNRRRTINILCDMFDSKLAYFEISDEENELYNSIIGNESRLAYYKNKLIESFFSGLLEENTYEGIISKRHKFIEDAHSICPEDIDIIDRWSNKVGDLLKSRVDLNELADIKKNIEHLLNSDGILDNHIIETLSTAELLYKKFAIPVYADRGFDYSSISSLYYQAFEEAYNHLIWGRYSSMLNDLRIDNQLYTKILQSKWDRNYKGLFYPTDVGYGYLPQNQNNWSHYIDYDKNRKKTKIKLFCMYGSFKEFLIKKDELPGFKDWVASKIGYNSGNQLFNDSEFLKLFDSFVDDVEKATDNRNNASHGGIEISLNQCGIDRKTVYSEIVRVHDLYLGLIQKLISIFRFRKN